LTSKRKEDTTMQRRIGIVSCALVAALASVPAARADLITLTETPLNDVSGSGYVAVSATTTTDMIGGSHLHAAVCSQAYSNGEHYVYFYQISNAGSPGGSAVTEFALGAFAGTVTNGAVGYLPWADVPLGFSVSNLARPPEQYGYVDAALAASDVFIYHGRRWDNAIGPGQIGRVIFIRSGLPPDEISGYVGSDFATASGAVVGAVPEPSIIGLLTAGGLITMVGRIVRKRR
jgi:hypothetical protein